MHVYTPGFKWSLFSVVDIIIAGAPLAETDLVPNEELGNEIKKWILMRSTGIATPNNSVRAGPNDSMATGSGAAAYDPYDF